MIKTKKNIVIIGPMTSGKSTVGRSLSDNLGRNFFDSDQIIVEKNGVSIDRIFEIEGEDGFRKREEAVLIGLLNKSDAVISTGGGAVLSEKFRAHCKKFNCIVVYLYTNQKEQYRRSLLSKDRPLLGADNRKEIIHKLMNDRKRYYNELATLTIDSSTLTIKQAVKAIEKKLLNDKN
jgi:shikimate kinase